MIKNAKDELLILINPENILAANIELEFTRHILIKDASPAQLENFLSSLDSEYDSGHGTQQLFGTVWLRDGGWLQRGEYNGREWWTPMMRPEIPECLC